MSLYPTVCESGHVIVFMIHRPQWILNLMQFQVSD